MKNQSKLNLILSTNLSLPTQDVVDALTSLSSEQMVNFIGKLIDHSIDSFETIELLENKLEKIKKEIGYESP